MIRGTKGRTVTAFVVCAVTAMVALAATSGPSSATSATANITGGTLSLVAPAPISFSATLSGTDQMVTATQSLDVIDATGDGVGWNVTATSTTFMASQTAMSGAAVTEQSPPTQSCDALATCTLANDSVAYPFTLPVGATAPTATKIMSASQATGMGAQTSVHTMRLAVPANAIEALYTSTWTYSLVSGP